MHHSLCKKCHGRTPPSVMAEEGLVVHGEKYDIVDIFSYRGDMLSSEEGAVAALIARVRCAWRKFREKCHL